MHIAECTKIGKAKKKTMVFADFKRSQPPMANKQQAGKRAIKPANKQTRFWHAMGLSGSEFLDGWIMHTCWVIFYDTHPGSGGVVVGGGGGITVHFNHKCRPQKKNVWGNPSLRLAMGQTMISRTCTLLSKGHLPQENLLPQELLLSSWNPLSKRAI